MESRCRSLPCRIVTAWSGSTGGARVSGRPPAPDGSPGRPRINPHQEHSLRALIHRKRRHVAAGASASFESIAPRALPFPRGRGHSRFFTPSSNRSNARSTRSNTRPPPPRHPLPAGPRLSSGLRTLTGLSATRFIAHAHACAVCSFVGIPTSGVDAGLVVLPPSTTLRSVRELRTRRRRVRLV